MGQKTIGLSEEAYDRLSSLKRSDESFSDLVTRLVADTSEDWRQSFGKYADAEGDDLLAATERSRRVTGAGLRSRQGNVNELFRETADDDA
jgi:predicted CopG family antitoxin